MDEEAVSVPVHQFINDHISSVAQLEMLLLLQTNPQQKWSRSEIARELRTDEAAIQAQLDSLCTSGLVKCDPVAGAYFFDPVKPEYAALSIALAQAYLIRRVTVISLIYSQPKDNLRAFSNAFRLRKDPPS